MAFVKATKKKAFLRAALHGPSGSGKTFSALSVAKHFGRVALLDTEQGSASKYADRFDFDVMEVTSNYHPDRLVEAIEDAAKEGYDALVIDSMTHFWNGPGGFLDLVEEEVKKQKARGNKPDSFGAWKVVDPVYKRMVNRILAAPIHILMTMRAKQEYVKEQDDRGKTSIRKVGMSPEMRDQFQYEADLEGMLDMEHNLVIGKTRCDALDGRVFTKPGKELAEILKAWLSDGAEAAQPKATKDVELNSVAAEIEIAVREAVAEMDLAKVNALAKEAPKRIAGGSQVMRDQIREMFAKAREDIAQAQANKEATEAAE